MALRENILRRPEGLFTYEDGTDAVNTRRWNENDNPLCTIPGCQNTAHNKGQNHGGFSRWCKEHLNLTGKNSYKFYKYDVPYCENMDNRLGVVCTSTIHDMSMLHVDHVDENHHNHDRKNLQTLCACCDAYKTNVIGKKVKSGKLSVADMLEYFEINKRIKKGTNSVEDILRRHTIDKILTETKVKNDTKN